LKAEEKCWKELSGIGGSYNATNPKDYVYGLLGITGIGLLLDYGDHKSIGDVCRDYCDVWLSWLQGRRNFDKYLHPVPDALWFLQHSGIGRLFTKSLADVPSWVPNVPFVRNNNRGFVDQTWIRSLGADSGIFSSTSEIFHIVESSLLVPAVLLRPIEKLGP
jgi:hypothetical protein